MPHFYFHIRDMGQVLLDPEGSALPDRAAAVNEAVVSARWLMGEELRKGWLPTERWFEIADETGQLVATVAFKDALRH